MSYYYTCRDQSKVAATRNLIKSNLRDVSSLLPRISSCLYQCAWHKNIIINIIDYGACRYRRSDLQTGKSVETIPLSLTAYPLITT